MNIKIDNEKDSPLLGRKSIEATITFTGATPNNADVKSKLAAYLKLDESIIVIKKIATRFGETSAKVLAYVYKTENDVKAFEPAPKKKKAAAGTGASG